MNDREKNEQGLTEEYKKRIEHLENTNYQLNAQVTKLLMKNRKQADELKDIKTSVTYRMARGITWLPRKIKKMVH